MSFLQYLGIRFRNKTKIFFSIYQVAQIENSFRFMLKFISYRGFFLKAENFLKKIVNAKIMFHQSFCRMRKKFFKIIFIIFKKRRGAIGDSNTFEMLLLPINIFIR